MGATMKVVLALLVALTAASVVYKPQFWIYTLLAADLWTPYSLFESSLYSSYRDFLLSRMDERPALPVPEMTVDQVSVESIMELSHDLTFPIVIRGALEGAPALEQWKDPQWWIDNYGDEEVICGYLEEIRYCRLSEFFEARAKGVPFYISGASSIFDRRPELKQMVNTEIMGTIEQGKNTAFQFFVGSGSGAGSDLHAAIGLNVFRQITQQKRWWFVPPSQTPFITPAINTNGFSAHTRTRIGKNGTEPSPWWGKLERYTTILDPGDVLINPPWFWHGVENIAEHYDDLVIGVPSRWAGDERIKRAAFKSNGVLTSFAFLRLFQEYGSVAKFVENNADLDENQRNSLERGIVGNRNTRREEVRQGGILKEFDGM